MAGPAVMAARLPGPMGAAGRRAWHPAGRSAAARTGKTVGAGPEQPRDANLPLPRPTTPDEPWRQRRPRAGRPTTPAGL